MWGLDPCFRSPTHRGQVQSYSHSCFSSWFLSPAEFCVALYIVFHWSGTPVRSQLVFCMHVSEGAFLMYLWREIYSSPPTPPPSCSPPIFNIKCFECVINCGCFYNSLLQLFIQINSQIGVKFLFLFLFLLSSGQVYNIPSTTWVSV